GTFSHDHLVERGDLDAATGSIFLPLWIYAGFSNTVTLTYNLTDGTSSQDTTTIATDAFSDEGGHTTPTVVKASRKAPC
ncbi:MAG: hypothetical protein ABI233_06775, partial [Chthoniobacterales bacterium]